MERILIVDDSLIARLGLIRYLEPDGYEIFQASNGVEALEMIERQKPHCVVLDMWMPGLDGFDVLRHLQKDESEFPVIVLSADIQETTKKRVFELGAYGFMNKPCDGEEVRLIVREAIKSNNEM
jgi:CheY-like chemotaxis protein